MNLTYSKPVLAIRHHLQKYLKRLFLERSKFLANLLEQRECVAKVDVLSTPIAVHFPDVQSKLLVKISSEVDSKLDKVKNLIDPLKKHHSVVNKARTDALNLIRKHPSDLDFNTLAAGEPTVPPLIIMLDWVDTIERQIREIYYTRMYYLENILSPEVVNSENLVKLWSESVPALLDTVRDCQEQSIYFLQEKYA
ncbi:unnamed protein product [Candidula unifasciata]|uniref:Uncharacterized protein n=1 Tax=Candidula unifasciata TaxID=100452 RepID=A0A8S3ZML6_9EUPU|nr:unnamed protein product [Candidula unifasciata]